MASRVAARFVRASGARPLVLGHRGARHAAPENTFAAFELARREGADGVELDVRLDGSGRVVVIHDRDLVRVTDGRSRARVDGLSTSELSALDVGQGERVPLLADVLAWAREHDLVVNVEVKSDVREQKRVLDGVASELARAHELGSLVIASSFHPGFVRVLALRLPEIPVCWLMHDRQLVFRRAPGWKLLGASGVHPQHTLLSSTGVRSFRASGALVGTWTVNDPAFARAYARFGVDVIITDAPARILEALADIPLP